MKFICKSCGAEIDDNMPKCPYCGEPNEHAIQHEKDRMVEMYQVNEAIGVDADEKLQQYYGIAKYYEAASYYKMYCQAGEKLQAKKYEQKMEQAKKEMGELDFASEMICEKLQIK